ncbi:unnamed protein product [Tetraodon nigroviridis]|uniref:(spotted green pufferfish) hypothetical protein n=1 Tax=Tetraodon nigroviridis TaxID=99883 RepID=Q4SEH3_TETNG|nr:unnamed protein product [Tetraodon nigroviridis]
MNGGFWLMTLWLTYGHWRRHVKNDLCHCGRAGMTVPPNPNKKEMRLQHEFIMSDHEDGCLIVVFMHAEKLLDRVIQHAELIYRVSEESCSLFDKWLLHSVLMLVQSWIKPLVHLQTTMVHYDDASDVLLNKIKWVLEKLISLEQGVVVLIKKLDILESIMNDHNLLSCFKKDAHKMEILLKLLKCRRNDICFLCLSYCFSNVARRTRLPGFPLNTAKGNTPTGCQDTLSVAGSLQAGCSECQVNWCLGFSCY